MNWDRIEGKWEQAKGELKTKWNKLTDDDLGTVAGKRDQLVGKLQERYGILKDDAERQIDAWVAAFDNGTDEAKAKAETTAEGFKAKAETKAEDIKAKVVELKDKAMDVAQDLKARALDVAQEAAYKVDELVSEQRQASKSDDADAKQGDPESTATRASSPKQPAKKKDPSRSSNPNL